MTSWPFLSFLIFLPLLGALFVLCIKEPPLEETDSSSHVLKKGRAHKTIRGTALLTTLATFALSLFVWSSFEEGKVGYQMVERIPLLGGRIEYHLGIDGVSLVFILLTTFLMPITLLASGAIKKRLKEYMVAFLVLESLILGVFCTLDLILFYIFFEASLVPMFLIVGIWGGERRIYASFKFFLYTFLGSVFMLLAMITLVSTLGTTDLIVLSQKSYLLPFSLQFWLWLGFFASFAVKLPMWPVHTWLPDAHVEAPTGGSVILAAILLKLGGYGFFRFSLPLFPEASLYFAPYVFVLSAIAIIYTSLVAFVQEDMKKLIAYSSVAHMGFVTIGLFSLNERAVEGALFQMISHGFISAAMFLCVGVVYDRLHTREIKAYGGLVQRMPAYALFFMLFTMANIGLPGTSGFVGEFLTLLGTFSVNKTVVIVATLGVILSATYGLRLYREVIFGALEKPSLKVLQDLTFKETGILALLALGVLGFGIYPTPFFKEIHTSVSSTLIQINQGLVSKKEGHRP